MTASMHTKLRARFPWWTSPFLLACGMLIRAGAPISGTWAAGVVNKRIRVEADRP